MNPWVCWNSRFAGCPPVGYLLRGFASDRWLRVYHLPQGKRYADTTGEHREVRSRQDAVADAVFGELEEVIAWIASYRDEPPGTDWRPTPAPPDWTAEVNEELGQPQPVFFYKQLAWVPGSLNEEFAAAARDDVGPLTVLATHSGEVFCPYDGGMDLILADSARVALFKSRFRDWLSPLPSGL